MLSRIAPSQLNKYACDLEDTLQAYGAELQKTQQFVQYQHDVLQKLSPHIERYKAMETLLTDPTLLASYVNDYFTHVHPVEAGNPAAQQPPGYERQPFPSMPSSNSGNGKINLSDVRPDQRWMVADQMEQAGLFNGKQLVIE